MNHKDEGKNPPAAAGNQSRSNQASFPASDLQDEGNAELPVPRPTLLFVVNVDWFFLSHRLPIALAAKKAGFHVVVTAADTGEGEVICSYGLEFRPLLISRSSFNPIREVCALANLIILYIRLRPDLVHHVTTKPILYGSLAAYLLPHMAVVNAVSGLGFTFLNLGRGRVQRALVKLLYRLALHHPRSITIFQNLDDLRLFSSQRLINVERAVLIRGSGVDCAKFESKQQPQGAPVVILASRMLWDKGVGEFIDAARMLHRKVPDARFVLVGSIDPGNRSSICKTHLEGWVQEGIVEWWGWREDMLEVLGAASIVVLPSYREGLPKVLLEAAATARPIVATDVPGCREIVRQGVNGLLVPPRDSVALAEAIQTLLRSPKLREEFGQAGREIAEAEFSEDIVVAQTLDLYRELLSDRWPRDTAEKVPS